MDPSSLVRLRGGTVVRLARMTWGQHGLIDVVGYPQRLCRPLHFLHHVGVRKEITSSSWANDTLGDVSALPSLHTILGNAVMRAAGSLGRLHGVSIDEHGLWRRL